MTSRRGFLGSLVAAAFAPSAIAKAVVTESLGIYSISYNLQAARQDEFGEAFFPTTIITPEDVGYSLKVRSL